MFHHLRIVNDMVLMIDNLKDTEDVLVELNDILQNVGLQSTVDLVKKSWTRGEIRRDNQSSELTRRIILG